MAKFEARENINCSLSDAYQFLTDFNNHQQLMPENMQNWNSTFNEANFGIQNMVQLSLQIVERCENSLVKIVAIGSPPFPVELMWDLNIAGDHTDVTLTINAELNMMMKMMASGPLQKLANHEVAVLKSTLEK